MFVFDYGRYSNRRIHWGHSSGLLQLLYANYINPAKSLQGTLFVFFCQAETLRMRALGRLKNLEYLDGIRVSDGEMTIALKMAAASRPSSFAILAHAWTDQSKPRTLGLVTTAHAILASSQNRPVKVVEDDSQWFVKVRWSAASGEI